MIKKLPDMGLQICPSGWTALKTQLKQSTFNSNRKKTRINSKL